MTYDLAPKLAQVVTGYCRPIQRGDYVVIRASTAAEEFITPLFEAVVQRGGNPHLLLSMPGLHELYVREASDEQFQFVDPATLTAFEKADVLLSVYAIENPKALSGIPAERIARAMHGQSQIRQVYINRVNDDSIRWNICAWPTESGAQQAGMGYHEYRAFVYRAAGLDQDDPVAYWTAFRDRQARLQQWLSDKNHVEVRGPGIDLSFDFNRRHWRSSYGERNFPDGEIFTAPVEDSVNGHVAFSFPTYYGGREVSGVQFTFKDGLIVQASAERGEDHLLAQMDTDAGAKQLSEFAIGTNWGVDRVTGDTLFDEKMGGTVHMALGNGYKQTGSQNESAIHWDMVHDMREGGEIWVDGTLFYRAGEFMVE